MATIGGFEPFQIKQKYGKLRVYGSGNNEIYEIIDKYDGLSAIVCEDCGKTGVYRDRYIRVICDKCYEESQDK